MLNDQYPVRSSFSLNFIRFVTLQLLSQKEMSLLLTPRTGVVRFSAMAKHGQGVSISWGELFWMCVLSLHLNSYIKTFLARF